MDATMFSPNGGVSFGVKRMINFTASNGYITFPSGFALNSIIDNRAIIPNKVGQPIYGIESIYNYTTERYVTEQIKEISDTKILFLDNAVESGDYIEMIYYTNDESEDKRITPDLIEGLFRHLAQMDRIDFGYYDPPTQIHGFDYSKYSFKQKLFSSTHGMGPNRHFSSGFNYNNAKAITRQWSRILLWSPNNENTVGAFAGDKNFEKIESLNTQYSQCPLPAYITVLYLEVDKFPSSEDVAMELKINIDGKEYCVKTSPDFYSSVGSNYPLADKFGDGNGLYCAFKSSDYESLPVFPPAHFQSQYCPHTIYFSLQRINYFISIDARVASQDDEEKRFDKWSLSIAGWLPKGYN